MRGGGVGRAREGSEASEWWADMARIFECAPVSVRACASASTSTCVLQRKATGRRHENQGRQCPPRLSLLPPLLAQSCARFQLPSLPLPHWQEELPDATGKAAEGTSRPFRFSFTACHGRGRGWSRAGGHFLSPPLPRR